MDERLNPQDTRRLLDLYEGRLAEYGHDVRTVGWSSEGDQRLRFSILCRGLELSGKRILDVGCGLGDLVQFLDDSGYQNYEYVGVELSSVLTEAAIKRFGGANRKFLAGDILAVGDIGTFDVVMSSGALSFRIADNIAVMKSMLAKMFFICHETVAVNFLSSYVDFELPKNFHYRPEDVFSVGRSLTPWVSLFHDYPLYEFTLHLFRKASQRGVGEKGGG